MILTERRYSDKHYFTDEHGRIQGEYRNYYRDGNLYIRCFYRNSKLHGEFKRYHDNGQLRAHLIYRNNKRHGEYKNYYKGDGNLSAHCLYVNDKVLSVDHLALSKEDKLIFVLQHEGFKFLPCSKK